MAFVAGIDFGTTNSSAAISNGDTPRMVPFEQSFYTIPTALYFPNDDPNVYFGRDATAHAIMEFVSAISKDSVRLKGLLYRTKSDKCCVFIPGFAGNPIDNDFIDILCSTFSSDHIEYNTKVIAFAV